ncbi:MAG: threonine synthase [Candidatus Cloacimonetes bacterium]|nr:threonine synthase [Candidatus Cloacimonadota bacterium]
MNKRNPETKIKTDKYYFECTTCGRKFNSGELRYLCPDCSSQNMPGLPPGGVLKTLYYYKEIKGRYKRTQLFDRLKEKEYLDILPIQSEKSLTRLKVGKTPLYLIPELDLNTKPDKSSQLPFELYLKDDSQNPTFSFKDRASDLVCAFASEQGYNNIVTASTGNAGSSLAGICASHKQKAIVIVPYGAPMAKLVQTIAYGARLIPVLGNYDQAFDLSISASEHFGWYNRNTAFNPFTIEGKKIVSLEIFQQLRRTLPDRIFVPVGDGVIISGVYKGFEDLLRLGLIESMPVIVAVQSAGSDNLIRNLTADVFLSRKSHTLADSISVDIPRNFYMARNFISAYQGESVIVSDQEILKAVFVLGRNTGLFTEPAAAAGFAGFLKYLEEDKINSKTRNVVLLTGSGLKDSSAFHSAINMPDPIEPDLNTIIKMNFT